MEGVWLEGGRVALILTYLVHINVMLLKNIYQVIVDSFSRSAAHSCELVKAAANEVVGMDGLGWRWEM